MSNHQCLLHQNLITLCCFAGGLFSCAPAIEPLTGASTQGLTSCSATVGSSALRSTGALEGQAHAVGAASVDRANASVDWRAQLLEQSRARSLKTSSHRQRQVASLQVGPLVERLVVTIKDSCKDQFQNKTRFHRMVLPSHWLDGQNWLEMETELDAQFGVGCWEGVDLDSQAIELSSFNDSFYTNGRLPHVDSIKLQRAQSRIQQAFARGNGYRPVVAVVDSGVNGSHSDITDNLWSNTDEVAGSVDTDGNGYAGDLRGYNFADRLSDPSPRPWTGQDAGGELHGGHVAGLIAARSNNSIGVVGVAGGSARIMDLNIFGGESAASLSAAIEAIEYATNNGADVINLSIVTGTSFTSLSTAIRNAVQAGVVVVAAAGNEGANLTVASVYPAKQGVDLGGLITVGATYARTLQLTNYSNFSAAFVEITAPGSAGVDTGLFSIGRGAAQYYESEGTSMATPLVSGAAALAVQYFKGLSRSYTPQDVEALILSSADKVPGLQSSAQCGNHLNIENLLIALEQF